VYLLEKLDISQEVLSLFELTYNLVFDSAVVVAQLIKELSVEYTCSFVVVE